MPPRCQRYWNYLAMIFKWDTIKRLQWTIKNMLETKEKNRKTQKETESFNSKRRTMRRKKRRKKNQMKILQLKETWTEYPVNFHWMNLAELKRSGQRTGVLEDRTEITQSKPEEIQTETKKWTETKLSMKREEDLTFMSLESHMERRR